MVVDASVIVSRMVPHDVHHARSRRWLEDHVGAGGPLIAPALLLAELAGAVARRTGAARLGRRAVAAVLRVPTLQLIDLDEALARASADVAARLGVRGGDAVYIATASALQVPLVTWDAEQREAAAALVDVRVPD